MKKLFLLILLSPLFAQAQSVFQCEVDGVTMFSQTPCDDQYNKIEVENSTGAGVSAEQLNLTTEACLNYHKPSFKLPNSVIIEGTRTVWTSDSSGARKVLILELSAMDINGDDIAPESYRCFLNHDGSQLSKVQSMIR